MNKHYIKILALFFAILMASALFAQETSSFNASALNAGSALNTKEIKEYFELRDSIILVNNEMKKIVMGSLREDFFGDEVEKNLNGCILFLEQRIDEFSSQNSQMQHHYLKKLKDLFTETVKLHPEVMRKIYLERVEKLQNDDLDLLEASLIKNSRASKEEEKHWHKPYFEPIDVRTLAAVSKGNSKGLKPYEFAAQAKLTGSSKTEQSKQEPAKAVEEEAVQSQDQLEQANEALKAAKLEEIRLETARLEAKKLEEARLEAARQEVARLEAEKLESEKQEAARLEAAKLEAAKLEAAKLEAEKQEAAKASKTQLAKLLPSMPLVPPQMPEPIIAAPGASTSAKAAMAIFSDLKQKIDTAPEPTTKLETKVTTKAEPIKKPAPAMVFDESFKHPRPMAIMVENHSLARPQTGLNEASLLYEIPVEGGITRFMGIYEKAPKVVGPVRSCREYFVDRALEASALYVHCGGSPKGYAYIASSHIFAIDEIRRGKGFFRDKSRKAPHNLYARGAGVIESAGELFPMKLKEPVKLLNYGEQKALGSSRINSASIKYHADYEVRIKYEQGSYQRYMNNTLHIDKETKKPLDAAVVVIQKAAMKTVDKVGRQEIHFMGEGDGWIMEQGRLTLITWQKESPEARTLYLDMSGKEYAFPRGKRVWVQVVSPSHKLEFKE